MLAAHRVHWTIIRLGGYTYGGAEAAGGARHAPRFAVLDPRYGRKVVYS
jgi:hypothetical protein